MTSHLFGGVWCASSSTYALRRTAIDAGASDVVRNTIMRSFYVDDLLTSVSDKETASEIINGTQDALNVGGFRLTKFVVNDPELLGQIAPEDRAAEVKEIAPEMLSKALGVQWDVTNDTFFYVSKPVEGQPPITRRSILSKVSTMYDPLGLVSPVVLQGRRIFQEATKLKLSWDDPVPNDIAQKWLAWLNSLNDLPKLTFDRCVMPNDFAGGVAELHHFCDGSQIGYGACAYLRVVNRSEIHVVLIAGKARLAPMKQITIPRLELSAAVLSIQLDVLLRRELDIPVMDSTFGQIVK